MSKLWTYTKKNEQLLITIGSDISKKECACSSLSLKNEIAVDSKDYKRLKMIINEYLVQNCVVIIFKDGPSLNLIKPKMKVIATNPVFKYIPQYEPVLLNTIYGVNGKQCEEKCLYIEDFIYAYEIINIDILKYEKRLSENIANTNFLNKQLTLRQASPFMEITTGLERYVLKYHYTKGRNKLIIIFNNLNGNKDTVKCDLFNQIEFQDFNFKSYAVLNLHESLSGYDGFYTYVNGKSLIAQIHLNLTKFIVEEGFNFNDVYLVGKGTGAIPAIIYGHRLNVNRVITINPRLNLVSEFNKKASSCIGNTFRQTDLERLNNYFNYLLKHERNYHYFTDEQLFFLNVQMINLNNVKLIGNEKLKNQFTTLMK